MDYKLSIRLKIADREYPIEVDASSEAALRNAGREINMTLRKYRDEFGVTNYQDLLAMFAIDCLMSKKDIEQSKTQLEALVIQKIAALEQLLNSVL